MQWRLGYLPALDGIRAVAAVSVVLGHTALPAFSGALGVDVFFALSGFLITSLLVGELADTGSLCLRRFWLRRALRLMPALVALVAVVGTVHSIMPMETREGIVPALLYLTNWFRALDLGSGGALAHTWSLGVEEQFYLLWPVVILALFRLDRSGRLALPLTLGAALVVSVVREVVTQTGALPQARVVNGFDFRVDALLIGAGLALAVHSGRRPKILASPTVVMAAIPLLVVTQLAVGWAGVTLEASRTVAALVTAVVIAAVVDGTVPRLSAALSRPTMRWIGVRSYALYLWHFPFARLLFDHRPATLGSVVLLLALSFGAAALSYRYVEAPFLRLKDRTRWPVEGAPQGRAPSSPPAPVSLGSVL